MTAAAAILLTTAACMFLAPTTAAAIAWVADRAADRAEAKRREAQGREVDAEWLAVLAATEFDALVDDVPITEWEKTYDALVCERLEKENWA